MIPQWNYEFDDSFKENTQINSIVVVELAWESSVVVYELKLYRSQRSQTVSYLVSSFGGHVDLSVTLTDGGDS